MAANLDQILFSCLPGGGLEGSPGQQKGLEEVWEQKYPKEKCCNCSFAQRSAAMLLLPLLLLLMCTRSVLCLRLLFLCLLISPPQQGLDTSHLFRPFGPKLHQDRQNSERSPHYKRHQMPWLFNFPNCGHHPCRRRKIFTSLGYHWEKTCCTSKSPSCLMFRLLRHFLGRTGNFSSLPVNGSPENEVKQQMSRCRGARHFAQATLL